MSKANKAKGGNRTVVIAAIGLAIVVAALLLVWRTMGPQSAAGGKTVTVQVVHEDGSRDFTLNTDEEFLGAALIADGVVEDNQSAYGLYILTADGETADESKQEWWKLTKEGEMVNTGADVTPIADGEHYELTLTVGYDGF